MINHSWYLVGGALRSLCRARAARVGGLLCGVVVLIGALSPPVAAAPAGCLHPSDPTFAGFSHRLVADVDTNTSTIEVDLADRTQDVCPTRIALASYRTQSTERAASLPQELFAVAAGTIDAGNPTLRLQVPLLACNPFQVDAIFVGEHNVGLLPRVDALYEQAGPFHDYFNRLLAVGFGANYRSSGTAALVAGGRVWSPSAGISWWLGQAGCHRDSPAEVPFERVGPGWLLTLIETNPGAPQLMVIAPDGSTYTPRLEATGEPMTEILDWRPDGTQAMVRLGGTGLTGGTGGSGGTVALVSLVDGSVEPLEPWVVTAGFTRPSGVDVVALVRDGSEQHLELRDGATVQLRSHPAGEFGLPWLYGLDGRTLVVGDRFGVGFTAGHLTMWSNDGTELHQLDSAATSCAPLRWWDTLTLLAACSERSATTPPYSRLWLVPADGGTAVALTPAKEAAVPGAEHGFSDAQWASPTVLVLQGEGVDEPMLFQRRSDGVPTPLRLLGVTSRSRLVRAGGGRLVLWDPDSVMFEPPLVTVRLDGDNLSLLRREAVKPVLDVASTDWGPATAVDGDVAELNPLPPFETASAIGGIKGQICPFPPVDRIPGALDVDRDGAVETIDVVDERPGFGGLVAKMVEHPPGGAPVVHGTVPIDFDYLQWSSSWYGDLNGDGQSEAVACVQGVSGSGHPLGAIVVFSPARGTWRVVLDYGTSGRPVTVDARRDGLVALFEEATVVAICRETTRQTFEWRDNVLVRTSVEVVSRVKKPPSDFTDPVTCPWETG